MVERFSESIANANDSGTFDASFEIKNIQHSESERNGNLLNSGDRKLLFKFINEGSINTRISEFIDNTKKNTKPPDENVSTDSDIGSSDTSETGITTTGVNSPPISKKTKGSQLDITKLNQSNARSKPDGDHHIDGISSTTESSRCNSQSQSNSLDHSFDMHPPLIPTFKVTPPTNKLQRNPAYELARRIRGSFHTKRAAICTLPRSRSDAQTKLDKKPTHGCSICRIDELTPAATTTKTVRKKDYNTESSNANQRDVVGTRSGVLNASQNRRWVQSSFRAPRAAEKQNLLVRRSTSLTVSENDVYDNCMDTSVDSKAVSQEISVNKECFQDNQNNVASRQQEQVAGVTAWGSSFEKLLEDAAGLHAFSEFLKKEFSAENIYFWTACERFKHIETENERAAQAATIFAKHLANNAPEPVNVDSQARILAEESLHTAGKDMFRHAQKQIFNLMKFDSYQRFIRSDLYKRCVEAEEKNQPLPFLAEDLDELLRTDVCSASNLKKSASNAEDRRRKSLLPWHRKARCKSRDRGECDIRRGKLVTSASSLKMSYPNSGSDIHSSRSSLSSFDTLPQCGGGGGGLLANDQISNDIKACSLCRVILSDGATTIVQTRPGETISQLIEKLLEKRGISYHFYDVVVNGSTKSIDINNSALYLAGKEVFVEQRIAFKLDLPDPKVISVKSKPKKQLCDVIRPILQKYNYTMESVQVLLRDTHEPLDLSQPVTVADGKRLQIVLKNVVYNDYQNQLHKSTQSMSKSVQLPTNKLNQNSTTGVPQNTLDEITNKVFNELLQGKVDAHNHRKSSDIGSLKSDECASETSSIFGRLRKRDSNIPGLKALRAKKVHKATINQTDDNMSIITHSTTGSNYNALAVGTKKPIIAKLKAGVKLQVTERAAENQDEFLEGLKRAQCARLEDQRGTEINSELPEFLKNKENMTAANKLRKIRANLNCVSKTLNSSSITNSEDQMEQQHSPMDRPQPAPRLSIAKCKINISSEHLEQENFTNCDNVAFNYNVCEAADIRPSKGPPPLPPKPKILPIKPSNWGQCGGDTIKTGGPTISLPSKIPIDINRKHIGSEQTGRNAYLDEPSSSFV